MLNFSTEIYTSSDLAQGILNQPWIDISNAIGFSFNYKTVGTLAGTIAVQGANIGPNTTTVIPVTVTSTTVAAPGSAIFNIVGGYYNKVRLNYVSTAIIVQTVTTVADVAGSLNNKYFLISNGGPNGSTVNYYVWYNVASGGTNPSLPGRTGIAVAISTGATAAAIATATAAAIGAVSASFTASAATNVVTVTNVTGGPATLASQGPSATATGFTFAKTLPTGVLTASICVKGTNA